MAVAQDNPVTIGICRIVMIELHGPAIEDSHEIGESEGTADVSGTGMMDHPDGIAAKLLRKVDQFL
jgi:hypothetical protein